MAVAHIALFLCYPLLSRGGHQEEGEEPNIILLLLDLYSLYAFLIIGGLYVFLIVDCATVVERLSKNMTYASKII